MTDTNGLREVIKESGYKLVYLAERCGLSYQGFMKKVNNETEFKPSEIQALKECLDLTDAQAMSLFFYSEG